MAMISKLTRNFLMAILATLSCALISAGAQAQLSVDITEGNLEPLPIAVPDFITQDPSLEPLGAKVAEIIRADLERSGLFNPLDKASFIAPQSNIDYEPSFSDWRVIKAEALVSGRIIRESNSRVRIEFRLWDIFGEKQLAGLRFATTTDNIRRISHKASDAVYEALTGEGGYFDSRIVFIDEKGPKTNRRKRLTIMDQDGNNPQYLLGGSDLILTPRFSPNSQKITFMSYENTVPQIYLLDIETGRRELLGNFPGMTFAPRFAPNGDALILSMVERGNSDIYVMDLRSRSTSRLTSDPAIDVSASFSPDGRKIVFNSDRGGSPQIYTMNADGSGVKRISFGKGRYSAPVWSPRGDLIAFTKSNGGQFSIGVVRPDGSGERKLTDGYLVEGPTWSPNGRVILFSKETRGSNGSSEIWSVDLTGRNLRRVNTPGKSSDPAWSPLLP